MTLPPAEDDTSLINPIEDVNNESSLWSVPTPKMARRGGSFRRSCSLSSSSVLLHQRSISQDIDPPAVRSRTSEYLGEPILRVLVELSPDKPQGIVIIREGDDIEEVAGVFVRKNDLPEELAVPLAEKIQEDLAHISRRETSPIRQEVASDDKIDFDLRNVEHRLSPVVHVPSPGENTPPVGAAPRRRTPKSAAEEFSTAVPPGDKTRRWKNGGHLWSGVRNRGRGGRRGGFGGGQQKLLENGGKNVERKAAEGPSVFSKLHEHAELRQKKLMRKRQELQQASTPIPHSAARPSTSYRGTQSNLKTEGTTCTPGHRLYTMHEKKIRQLVQLQRDHAVQRDKAELQGATFKPSIGTSQRVCPGVSRFHSDKENTEIRQDDTARQKWREEKAAQLRMDIEQEQMKECSFTPHLNSESLRIAHQRNPFQRGGSHFETLYQDAFERRERKEKWQSYLPEGVTFVPDIGAAHERPSNDENREQFFRRLTYSRQGSTPRNICGDSLASGCFPFTHSVVEHSSGNPSKAHKDYNGVSQYTRAGALSDSFPITTWAATTSIDGPGNKSARSSRRNERFATERLSHSAGSTNGGKVARSGGIFERLFNESVELKERAAASEAEAIKWSKELSSEARALERSREILQAKKMEKYDRLYRGLGGKPGSDNPNEWINPKNIRKDAIEDTCERDMLCLRELSLYLIIFVVQVAHIVSYVEESGEAVSWEQFIAAVDYKIRLSRKPSSHLFISNSINRKEMGQPNDNEHVEDAKITSFTPRIDPHSSRLLERHQNRAGPIHERLVAEKRVWETKIEDLKREVEEKELEECKYLCELCAHQSLWIK
ncbi:hypothetical protein FOL47_005565 [Perkinsus chesapeaki]|uniref:Uncharacterized protein n=1 Tax=Perkinsus chesapeaki TaxID=330153 RepID=A0A7J6LX10_PERCH|nr:hypothetical protein FOL47_005565 [Perkinsus chesapeaki]